MKTAKEVLTKYSDGDYTQFKGYGNILMAMQEYAKQYHEARMKEELIEFLTFREENTHYSYIVKRDKYVDDYLATCKNK